MEILINRIQRPKKERKKHLKYMNLYYNTLPSIAALSIGIIMGLAASGDTAAIWGAILGGGIGLRIDTALEKYEHDINPYVLE